MAVLECLACEPERLNCCLFQSQLACSALLSASPELFFRSAASDDVRVGRLLFCLRLRLLPAEPNCVKKIFYSYSLFYSPQKLFIKISLLNSSMPEELLVALFSVAL